MAKITLTNDDVLLEIADVEHSIGCLKQEMPVRDELTRLQGEAKVMRDLLTECLSVIKTIEPESTEESEMLSALVDKSTAAIAAGEKA